MQFSEYTVVAAPEQSLDPLGFTQPFSALRSRLYPQFTVLANAPAYHGVLALVYDLLATQQMTPGQDGFARRFREAECLWGLACVAAGTSVLNITKYEAVLEGRDTVRLADVGRGNALYRSLAYGTLGHYSSPSVAWGFLERGGTRLTPLGAQLARGFARRGRLSLRDALAAWLAGATFTRAELLALGRAYCLQGEPSPGEREAWAQAVATWRQRGAHCAVLWEQPPAGAALDALRNDAGAYREFFTALAAQYPALADVLLQARRFETMSALCQFIFNREYLLCHDAGAVPAPGDLEHDIATTLVALAQEAQAAATRHTPRDWMTPLGAASDYDAVAALIIRHHVRHQQGKGAQPYIEEDRRLRVRERLDRAAFTDLHEQLAALADADARVAELSFHYRRDWHFDRALRYARYLGEPV